MPRLGVTAFQAEKKDARAFWADLTTGADAAGNPTALSDGATRVDLDGRVEATLEDSVPQIHAPQAWAAGYDGTGTTVAVLDTGYDPTHPDLAGRVVKTANFTTDATVTDGNGHGSHVASTVGGSGAASQGLRTGVAPGADLMVGKVLTDGGYGEDSWVLAGMVWAVDQGADVISMSLGGDVDDGTHPLSRAVNELSASSDSLFVIAAGNGGAQGASTITSPGAADAALTVGAVDVNNVMADFSGRGPRLRDGVLKPEVVAPGVDVTAARAAGTALGPIVDDYYTTISGTSMATPHVAGLAAILKEKHPDWDGEMLKAAIANSAVPVADATAFDAGTGRVDALAAIREKVLAPASLSLGSYAWPYSDLETTRTPLTYTNTSTKPVRLTLALTGQDGSAEPTGSMTLAAQHLRVPAGGTSSVDVILDPTVAEPGSYSAVVTATPNDGGGTVRTGLAYLLESEHYDVTVTIKPRAGSQSVSHQLGLSSYGDAGIYEQRSFDALPGAQSATFRLPPGTYSTGAISFGQAADGAKEGVVTYEPSFTVTKDTKIVLDENQTGRFDYQVDKPVVNDGAILDVGWSEGDDYTGFTFFGSVDRLYARPSAGLGGHATVASNWLLSEPEGLRTPQQGKSVAAPGYMYDLVRFWGKGVPNGGTVSGTGKSVAALVEHYNGMGSTSADGMQAVEELIGWVPSRGGVANIGLVHPVPFPSTVTHYVSANAVWERTVAILDAQFGGEYARLYAPRTLYRGGSTTRDSWFGGPVGSRVSPLFKVDNGSPPPTREGDEMFVTTGAFTDAAGHMTNSDIFSTEFDGKIYADDELVLDMFASVFMNTTVPAGKHHFRVVTDTQRENLFWQDSTHVHTSWTFDSSTAPDGPEVLPMLGIDYQLALSSINAAPAGRYGFDVRFSMPDTVKTQKVVTHRIAISWDGGAHWRNAPMVRCGDTSCQVQVVNRAGGHASLRVVAADAAGRTVTQQIVDAYSVGK